MTRLRSATLTIARSVGKVGREPVYVKKPKTKRSVRRIALDPATLMVLEAYRRRQEEKARALGTRLDPDGYIFSDNLGGDPWKPNTVTQKVGRIMRSLGLDHLHLHSTRHMAATYLLAGGLDVRTVAGRLGHADGGQLALRTYGHVLDTADRKAALVAGQMVEGFVPNAKGPAPEGAGEEEDR